jgi:hypothetical protein
MGIMQFQRNWPLPLNREVVPQAASLPYRRLPVGNSKNNCPQFMGMMQFQSNWKQPMNRVYSPPVPPL